MAEAMVIDASAWLALLLQEEKADLIAAHLTHHPLMAPELIRYEAANGILQARRRGRLLAQEDSFKLLLREILDFPIEIVSPETWWLAGVRMVQKHPLTFYDAAYVGLAGVLGLPLLTLDDKILQALKLEKMESVL